MKMLMDECHTHTQLNGLFDTVMNLMHCVYLHPSIHGD